MRGKLKKYFTFPRISIRTWKVWMRNRDVFMKTYKTNFIPPFLEPVLYLLALGFGLGSYIQRIGGLPYVAFIAPSLIAISIMYSAFFDCTYASYVRMYYQKTYDAIIATPLSLEEVIAGEMLWGATKSLINASIILGVIVAFRLAKFPYFLLIIPFAFLGGMLFAAIAMCFTALVPNMDSFNYPYFLFITPMFLFCGTFFPVETLPRPIQIFSYTLLPLTHVVKITRALTLGILDWPLSFSLLWIIGVGSFFFILSINLMRRRLIG